MAEESLKMKKIKKQIETIGKLVFEAMFCEYKNGDKIKTFSSKKFWAFCFLCLAFWQHLSLELWPTAHWTTFLTKKAVHESIQISLIASLDALAGWATTVYYLGKKNNAA